MGNITPLAKKMRLRKIFSPFIQRAINCLNDPYDNETPPFTKFSMFDYLKKSIDLNDFSQHLRFYPVVNLIMLTTTWFFFCIKSQTKTYYKKKFLYALYMDSRNYSSKYVGQSFSLLSCHWPWPYSNCLCVNHVWLIIMIKACSC